MSKTAGSRTSRRRTGFWRAGLWRERIEDALHKLSLRARLLALVTGLLVVALVLVGSVTLVLLRTVLVAQVDGELRDALRPRYQVAAMGGYGGPPSENIVQIYSADGRLLEQRPSNDDLDVPTPTIVGLTVEKVVDQDGQPFETGNIAPADDSAPPAAQYRAVAEVQRYDTGAPFIVVALRDLSGVETSQDKVAGWFVLVGLLVVVACALLGWFGITRAFRPLREVEAVADAFGGGDTSRRVAAAPRSTEVGRLGHSVNEMLDDIETSMAAREASENRMRRFVADASHELRTPLAAVRGFAELHRMGAITAPDDVTTAFGRVEHEAIRMGGLVEDLLVLARLDEQRPMTRKPVDLLQLVVDASHDAGALAPDRAVALVGASPGTPPEPVVITGDDSKLRQVIANLLANALRHTPAGTPIELGVGLRDGSALLRIVDHGPGIPPEDLTRVFERFYRADPSRARHQGGGSGLGLAIVAAIVTAHGGAVRIVPTPGGGATAEVALPLDAPSPAAPPPAAPTRGAPAPAAPAPAAPSRETPTRETPTRDTPASAAPSSAVLPAAVDAQR